MTNTPPDMLQQPTTNHSPLATRH